MKQGLLLSVIALCIALSSAATVLEVIQTNADFSNLKAALARSSQDPGVTALVARLNDTTAATTFFAPNNKAFTKDDGTVTATFLKYYLVPKTVSPLVDGELLVTLLNLTSLNGANQYVKVTKQGANFFVNGASQVEQNLPATNGQVYGVSANLSLPQDLWTVVKGNASLSTLTGLIQQASLGDVLATTPALTVFGPDNSAFAKAPAYLLAYLQQQNNSDASAKLAVLLKYHVGAQAVYLSTLAVNSTLSVPTADSPQNVNVAVGPARQYTVDDANVVSSDVLASNGAANVIDQVLVPNNLGFNLANALVGLADTGSLKTYVAALLKSTSTFSELGNSAKSFTVFAPSDVDASPEGLNYTIAIGSHSVDSLKDGQVLQTLSNTLNGHQPQMLRVTVTKAGVYVGFARIAQPDVGKGVVNNGLIHVLDGGLPLPRSVAADVASSPSFSTLDRAIVLANLTATLSGDGNFTVFVPNNTAFATLPTSVVGYLVSNISAASNAAVKHVLLNHVYDQGVLYYNLGQLTSGPLKMASGLDVNVNIVNSTIHVGTTTVALTDLPRSNGVVQFINGVLLPNDLAVSNEDLLYGLGDTTFIQALNRSGLLANLTKQSVTIFAPSNRAFDKLSDKGFLTGNVGTLKNILLTHMVNRTVTPAELSVNLTLTSISGRKLFFKPNGNTFSVGVSGSSAPTGALDLAASSSNLGATTSSYVYSIDQVLGQDNEESSGLTSTEIGLIVAGCIVGVLLAGALVGGAVWYYKRRHGYESIDGDAY